MVLVVIAKVKAGQKGEPVGIIIATGIVMIWELLAVLMGEVGTKIKELHR